MWQRRQRQRRNTTPLTPLSSLVAVKKSVFFLQAYQGSVNQTKSSWPGDGFVLTKTQMDFSDSQF